MAYNLSKLICLFYCFFAITAFALEHPLKLEKGLKRFDDKAVLGSHSEFDIKDVYIGDNVLASSILLLESGGELHNIPGGSRSTKVKISFFQPYQESRLEQLLELKFNKTNGFIEQISSTYKIDSAYLNLSPVREKVIAAAIKKYGEPLSLSDIQKIVGQSNAEISISAFINKLSVSDEVSDLVKMYFKKRDISRTSKFTGSKEGRAIMHTGFDLCYLWQKDEFTEILSLCAFEAREANASNRGVELNLQNFKVQQLISEQQELPSKDDALSIAL